MHIGTRVRLASGGPTMLVTDLDPQAWRVMCSWDGGEGWFSVVCLDVIRRKHIVDWGRGGDHDWDDPWP